MIIIIKIIIMKCACRPTRRSIYIYIYMPLLSFNVVVCFWRFCCGPFVFTVVFAFFAVVRRFVVMCLPDFTSRFPFCLFYCTCYTTTISSSSSSSTTMYGCNRRLLITSDSSCIMHKHFVRFLLFMVLLCMMRLKAR